MNTRHFLSALLAAQACLLLCLCAANTRPALAGDKKPADTAASAFPDTPRLRYRIVVDQGKWNEIRTSQWYLPPEVGAGIQAQLVDKLEKSGYFIVMEREATAESQASQEDQIDAAKRASLAPGAIAAPRQQRTVGNFIITPSVVGFVPTGGGNSGVSFGGIHLGGKKAESTVTLSIRISDAQTSEIIDTQTATGKAEAKSNGIGLNFQGADISSEQFQSSPAGQAVDRALDDAVAKIVARLSKEPWTALVAAQDKATNRVIINAGNQSGVQIGQVFTVYHAGNPVLDPDTGEKISEGDEVKIGRIKIVRVDRNASYADILEGTTFQPRDIVKATSN